MHAGQRILLPSALNLLPQSLQQYSVALISPVSMSMLVDESTRHILSPDLKNGFGINKGCGRFTGKNFEAYIRYWSNVKARK